MRVYSRRLSLDRPQRRGHGSNRPGVCDEALRRRRGGGRRLVRDPRGRVLLDARSLGVRQDDDAAHDRGLRGADQRPHPAARGRRDARAAGQAARQHGVPVLRALPAHERVRERRVRAARQARARGRCAQSRHQRAARGAPRGHGGAQAGTALGWPAAARRPRARARQRTCSPPARRTAGRARPQAAAGDAARAQGDPDPHAHDLRVRHARPGRGAHDERSHRRHERRAGRADRRAARALRTSCHSVRRRFHRHLESPRAARRPRQ